MRAGNAAPKLLVQAARMMTGNAYSGAAISAGGRLSTLRKRGMLTGAALPAYRATLDAIYAPLLAQLGFDPKVGAYLADDPDRRQMRAGLVSLLAGEARDAALRMKLVAAVKALFAGKADALDPSFYAAAFGAYVTEGDQATAEDLYKRALASEDALMRGAMLNALAGTGDPAIGEWLLSRLAQGPRPNEQGRLVRIMAYEPGTREIALGWLISHYDRLVQDSGIFAASGFPSAAETGCSTVDADRVEALFRPKVVQHQRGALELDRTIEQIRSCAALKEARGVDITTMFE